MSTESIIHHIFYDTFVEGIVDACRYFLEVIDRYSYEEIDCILSVLRAFSEDLFLDNLLGICKKTLRDQNSFFIVMVHSILSKKCHKQPGRIKSILTELQRFSEECQDVELTINEFLLYWGSQEESLQTTRDDRIKCYKNLTGGVFHSIRHLKDNIGKSDDIDFATESWNKLSDEIISKILPLLRAFIGNRVSTEKVIRLNDEIAQLHFYIMEGNRLLSVPRKLKEEPDILLNKINQVASTIHKIIYDLHDGIVKTLEEFKTDIKQVLKRVIDQQYSDLLSSGIDVDIHIPKENLLVFGERVSIAIIFQNLVENVWKHSKGKLFKIAISIDTKEDTRFVKILFMDDGTGMGSFESVVKVDGLKKVWESTLSCSGRALAYWRDKNKKYEMSDVGEVSVLGDNNRQMVSDYLDQFGTVVEVSLPYLI